GCFLVRAYPTPGEAGRHVSRISFYLWPGTEAGSSAEAMLRTIAETFSSIIRDEDYVVAASQQRSASAGSLEHVLFGRNEPALHHYHSTYRAVLGMPPLPLLADHDVH
ncbi:MAG: hypothetical protein IIC89_09070, partial [Chloroflexi bacterium]|nr:hypothetical protein [Chloroflexota bacterium]